MSILSSMIAAGRRFRRAARCARKCYRDGGVTEVSVACIRRGNVLANRRILITGGSRGIGLAIARKCLDENARVVITGRHEAALREAAAALGSDRLHTLTWDVGDTGIASARIDEAEALAGGRIDTLCNNAGILTREKSFLDVTEASWDAITAVNAKGLLFTTQAMCRRWIADGGGGRILNVSSMRGVLGVLDGPYGMSKWGLVGLTQGLGLSMLPHGIIVNGIAPGVTDTSIPGIDAKENAYNQWLPPSFRVALPEEIAELAVFLISDAAKYIVGQTIVVDGGYSLRA